MIASRVLRKSAAVWRAVLTLGEQAPSRTPHPRPPSAPTPAQVGMTRSMSLIVHNPKEIAAEWAAKRPLEQAKDWGMWGG